MEIPVHTPFLNRILYFFSMTKFISISGLMTILKEIKNKMYYLFVFVVFLLS